MMSAPGFFSSFFAELARQATREPITRAAESPATVIFTQRLRAEPVTGSGDGERLNSMMVFLNKVPVREIMCAFRGWVAILMRRNA
jgi:hypothetical protein